MDLALKWLHITGNIVWVGAILAVGLTLAGGKADPKARGAIALDIYKRLAVPAFITSFVAGVVKLGMDPGFYLKQHHWMHAKLPLALGVIALHHVIGGRARKTADGTLQEAGSVGTLTAVLALLAVGAAFFAVFKLPD
jgi:putative membrane protein